MTCMNCGGRAALAKPVGICPVEVPGSQVAEPDMAELGRDVSDCCAVVRHRGRLPCWLYVGEPVGEEFGEGDSARSGRGRQLPKESGELALAVLLGAVEGSLLLDGDRVTTLRVRAVANEQPGLPTTLPDSEESWSSLARRGVDDHEGSF